MGREFLTFEGTKEEHEIALELERCPKCNCFIRWSPWTHYCPRESCDWMMPLDVDG